MLFLITNKKTFQIAPPTCSKKCIFTIDMKKYLKSLLLAVLPLAITACSFSFNGEVVVGNGVEVTKTIDVQPVTAIVVAGSMDVVYMQGPQSVVLTADENLAELYTVEEIDGVLHISMKSGYSVFPKVKTFVAVSSETLSKIKVSGSGDCDIKGTLRTDGDFVFSVSGSGDLEADAIVCNSFDGHINGSGDIEVDALTADSVNLTINGSGDIKLGCKDAGDINARINGSGDIVLSGKARSLNSKVNGAGDISTGGLQLMP